MDRYKQIERSIITTYRKRIWSKFIEAIKEFQMIKEGDKIAVCISGGKDSVLLAKCFQQLHRHSDIPFELEFIIMNPGYNEKNLALIKENAELLDIPIDIFSSNIFDVVDKIDDNPCYLCARMRRGCLYDYAKSKGCNKIALGHHFDDVIETILMSILYGSQMQSMPPKLKSTNHIGMELIRPFYFVKENDIIAWVNHNELEFIQCACRFTEKTNNITGGIMDSKRLEMKALIKKLKEINPNVDINILKSSYNVNIDTMISYKTQGKKHHFLDDYDN